MNHRKDSTDLEVVRQTPERFTWGEVKKIHDIGPYTFVEYGESRESSSSRFHVYVNGKSTNLSCMSLESALIEGVAHKQIPELNQADRMAYACKLLLNI